jgi:type VI secretion system secreted protein Hcp
MSQNNLFMKIEGITGTVTDKGYENWIAIENFSSGLFSSAKMDNGSGQLNSQGIHFDTIPVSKKLDATTAEIMSYVAQGKNITKIEIVLASKTAEKYLELGRWTYEKCLITGQNITVSNSAGIPEEEISFAFGKFNFVAHTINHGSQEVKHGPVGWDLVENTKL